MLSLARFSRPVRIVIRFLQVAGVAGIALYEVGAVVGYGDVPGETVETLYTCLFVAPAALCLLRAALVREERVAWAAFGIGILIYATGYWYYFAFLENLESAPYPSLADAGWLCYFVGTVVGLLALMRSRLQHFRRSLWIDACVGGLAIAALGASLLVDPILAATGGSAAAVATNMAYPLFDALIISIVLAVFVMSGWRPGRGWMLLGAVYAARSSSTRSTSTRPPPARISSERCWTRPGWAA